MYTEKELSLILHQKRLARKSLRQIADEFPPGISYGDIARCLRGDFPKSYRKRLLLDLPAYAQVIAIAEEIPEGTLVLKATLCPCGQYFISNHPRRKKCFQCSPYRARPQKG